MSCSALTSQASSKKHSEISDLKSLNVGKTFFQSLGSSETSGRPTSSLQTVESMVVPISPLPAEVLWLPKVVKNHFTLHSCLGLNDLFKSNMFPHRKIAKTFKLSKTKSRFLISFKLSPLFKNVLLKSINASPYFVLLYDDSINKILQNEPMDLHARYLDDN